MVRSSEVIRGVGSKPQLPGRVRKRNKPCLAPLRRKAVISGWVLVGTLSVFSICKSLDLE